MAALTIVRKKRKPLYCSFCGKTDDEVFTLVAGTNVSICDECVAAAQSIITEKKIAAGATAVIGRTTAVVP